MCRPYPLWGCVGNSGLVDRTAAFDRLRGAYVDGGVTIDVDIAKVRSGDVAEHVAVVTVVIVVVDEDEAIVVAIVITVAVAVAADKPAVVKEPVVLVVDGHDGGGLKDARSVLGVAGVGGRLKAHCLDGVVTAAGDANRLTHVAAVGVLIDILTNIDGWRYIDVADVAEYVAVVIVELTVVAIVVAVAVKVAEDDVEVIIVVVLGEGRSCGQH